MPSTARHVASGSRRTHIAPVLADGSTSRLEHADIPDLQSLRPAGDEIRDRGPGDDDRAIEPTAPGVAREAAIVLAVFRRSQRRPRRILRLDPRPARATGLGRSVRVADRQARSSKSTDPAPGDDGNDDRGTSGGSGIAFDDAAASDPRDAGSTHDSGTAAPPATVEALEARRAEEYDATDHGNVVRPRTGLNGRPAIRR